MMQIIFLLWCDILNYFFFLFSLFPIILCSQVLHNFSSVHLSHVELKNMGQQREKGRYPVHFHMCGDVDQRGGYLEPTYVDGLSIHHSFSRCLTIHATNGLLVSYSYNMEMCKTLLILLQHITINYNKSFGMLRDAKPLIRQQCSPPPDTHSASLLRMKTDSRSYKQQCVRQSL